MDEGDSFHGFSKETVGFLKDLTRNNNTTWFHANKGRYEEALKKPAGAFLNALVPAVRKILPGVSDGKVSRINRDIRFSKDKTPYKTHVALMLWDGKAKGMGCSSLYFHLEADKLILGDGVHEFEDKALDSFRRALVHPSKGKDFKAIVGKLGKYDIGGGFYKKVPAGFDASHENAEYLKHKGIYVGTEIPLPKEAFSEKLVPFCVERFKDFVPFHRWLLNLA